MIKRYSLKLLELQRVFLSEFGEYNSALVAQKILSLLNAASIKEKYNEIQLFELLAYNRGSSLAKLKYIINGYLSLFYFFFIFIMRILLVRKKSLSEKVNIFYGLEKKNIDNGPKNCIILDYLKYLSTTLNIENSWLIYKKEARSKFLGNTPFKTTLTPLLDLYLGVNNFKLRIKLALHVISQFLRIIVKIPFQPQIGLLIPEILFECFITDHQYTMNHINKVFVTTSNIFVQPYLFQLPATRRPSTMMIWYSSSAHNMYVKFGEYFDDTIYQSINVDQHLVWSEIHKTFLERFKKFKIQVVGPQLFYLPKNQTKTIHSVFRCALFDITPLKSDFCLDKVYSEARASYFLETVFNLVTDVSKKFQVVIQFEIKPKRQFQKFHSPSYLRLINKLSSLGVVIENSDINLFDYINDLDLVITNSLTSVSDIAESLSVPLILFDPVEFYECYREGSNVARTNLELQLLVEKYFKSDSYFKHLS